MKALVLCGGSGTRLRPLTYTNAKQLIPVTNKPIVFYILEKIAAAGIRDVGIIVGDTAAEVKSAIGNGDQWDIRVTYIHQPLPLGLAHAVKTASDFLGDEDFLMILGDNLFSMSLGKLIENFRKNLSNAALLLHSVEDPSHFGVALVKNNEVVQLVEKPAEWISDLIITGVYIFDKHIFEAISSIHPSGRGELEITDAVQKLLESGGKVSYELIEGWWKDTGKLSDLLEANRLVLDSLGDMPDRHIACTDKVYRDKNTTILNSVIRGPVAIGSDCIITNSYIGPYTSIGNGVRLSNCEIENSILLSGIQIENITKRISDSLIGKSAVIRGKNTRSVSNCFLLGDNSEVYIQNDSVI